MQLYIYIFLGLDDDLENFTLTLNNPSTQAEMLKIEQNQLKVTLYKDAVSDAGNGFGAYSMTRAKRDILGMSEEEIRVDLEQQRMEKAASAEMEQTSTIIKKTGIFDRVDTLYGDPLGGEGTEETGDTSGDTGGDTGDFDLGGGLDIGGAEESAADSTAGGEATEAEAGAAVESTNNKENLLLEQEKKLKEKTKKYQNVYLKKLIESIDTDDRVYRVEGIDKEVDNLNSKIEKMSEDIDNILKEEEN